MATPRKNWSRHFDEVLGTGWTDAVIADLARLQAFLNMRWARYGLTPDEACECELSVQDAMLVTNTRSPKRAINRLLALPSRTPNGPFEARLVHAGRAQSVKVYWPKLAEYQGYMDRNSPNSGQSQGESRVATALSETRQDETRQDKRERAPERASHSLMNCLPAWNCAAEQKQEWLRLNLPKIEDLVDAQCPGDRNAAIRAKVRSFAQAERQPPRRPLPELAPVAARLPEDAETLARKRLAALDNSNPSDAHIRAHIVQFREVFEAFAEWDREHPA